MSIEESSQKKRGPGRPPKKVLTVEYSHEGIVSEPKDKRNSVEIFYNCPYIMKLIFDYIKSIKSTTAHIYCNKESIHFITKKVVDVNKTDVEIKGNESMRYYCASDIWLGINGGHVNKVLHGVDKSLYDRISLSFSPENREKFVITLFDDSIESSHCRYITLSNLDVTNDILTLPQTIKNDIATDAYPISFTLPVRIFTKLVTTIADQKCPDFEFRRFHDQPLMVYYEKQQVIECVDTFGSDEKIEFKSTFNVPTMFICKLQTKNVKPVASAIITDKVRIMCKQPDKVMFELILDDAVTIHTILDNS